MISVNERIFKLDTASTSYVFSLTDSGHLQHIHYGRLIADGDIPALTMKNTIGHGTSVDYSKDTPGYSLDNLLLEYSGIGKGDYRHSPTELIMPDGGFTTDFVYDSHTVSNTAYASDCGLPFATGEAQTLSIRMTDRKYKDIALVLNYTVFADCNVIARNAELHCGENEVIIRKFMSMMVDLPDAGYKLLTLDGSWAKETHIHERPLTCGIAVNDSTVGASSNRHNPAFMLKAEHAGCEHGEVYGFNLVYSGNHYSAAEVGVQGTLRVMTGINPHCFLWKVKPGESFVTPQAIMSYSAAGTNALSQNMHDFVNNHIIREEFRGSDRPVVVNNWEATFFNFNRRKLLALANKAKRLGVEMFVLDDGWFGQRNHDRAGLGDWVVNTKKLPGGIKSLARAINRRGMRFGLWFEPECVNEDSDLYRAHPDWAIKTPGRQPSLGRNQMTLDLTRREVRDYIVDALDAVLTSANVEYVKWDYNRHMSDVYSLGLKNQGEFYHRYILGLYEVLDRIFRQKHPNVLLESCSSGGNRYDLGILCFSPQVWTSDDTDASERLDIQRGILCFYPPSTMSCHVSMTPNQQTLRSAPLSTRFNVAAFGVMGYELDFGELTPNERKQIKEQIAFYKAHRRTFQYGRFSRYDIRPGERESWQTAGEGETMAAVYNLSYCASPARDSLRVLSAQEGKQYTVDTVKQYLRINRFGSLIKHISPVSLKSDGAIMRFADRHFALTDGREHYDCSGAALQTGIQLAMQYSGTGYHPDLRMTGDFGSTLYAVSEKQPDTQPSVKKQKKKRK